MKTILRSCKTLQGRITVGGDKSITHRSLIIASLAQGTSTISGHSTCDDCRSTMNAIRTLGIDVRDDADNLVVHGQGTEGFREPQDVLQCGNSGTTMRLLSGVLAGQSFYTVLDGDASLRNRPMDRIVKPLRVMGANITGRATGRFPPLCIRGNDLSPIDYTLPMASAQVKSAVLLAGLCAHGTTTVRELTPTRDHTERMLELFSAEIKRSGDRTCIQPGTLRAQTLVVPGDISSAAYFIVLGCLSPNSDITVEYVGVNETRIGILDTLKLMGACIEIQNTRCVSNEPVADIRGVTSSLKGIELSGTIIPRIIDELPLLAVVATQAQGRTVIRGAQELRVKETDRIAAIVHELKAMGAQIQETDDGFIIDGPTPLYGASCTSHEDHRIAMSCTIAGLIAEGKTHIEDVACVSISCPEFFAKINEVSNETVCVLEA